MRVIRIHLDAPLAPGARALLHGKAAGHVRRVLRLGVGDAVTLFNGDGSDYPARVTALPRDAVELEVGAPRPAAAESPLRVRLVQGIARGERMDVVVQKATELGVAAIQPVATARGVVRLDGGAGARRQAHWQGVVVAACEQCGRARVPEVAAPMPLADWLARPPADGAVRLVLFAGAPATLAEAARGAQALELLVGPEGGLEDRERVAAERAGYRACRLGPRVLRSETAAIAALAVAQAVAGDL